MKKGTLKGHGRGVGKGFLKDSDYLTNLLVALSEKKDTPELIAYLADERKRLLIVKSLVSPISESDRELAERARKILRGRGIDPENLKKRVEPAAFALGLMSTCDLQIDYYDVLGVQSSATPSELRAAYRKRAFELHPDTRRQSSENEADFVTVKAAYDSLMDSDSRKAFDQCRRQLNAWHEEDINGAVHETVGRRPPGKVRKTVYRVAAVVLVLVVFAWVLSVLYETETMLEVAQITSPRDVEPTREMAGSAVDTGEVEVKAPVASEEIEEKTPPTKAATKKPVLEKAESEKATPEKSEPAKAASKKPKRVKPELPPMKTAALAAPEPVEIETPEPVKATAEPKGDPHKTRVIPRPAEKRKPAIALKVEDKEIKLAAVTATSTPPDAAEKKEPPIPESELVTSPPPVKNKKLKAVSVSEPVEIKQSPSVPPSVSAHKPSATSFSTEKRWNKKPKIKVAATVSAPPSAVSTKPVEPVVPPESSLQTSKISSLPTFPEIPIPKTHQTPYVKRSQVLDFLKKYTAAYERGNAETFFSYFTPNATENGKPVTKIQPDYLEIWKKVRSLDYRISLDETEQEVESDTVSMKGRFDLGWIFLDGQSGQSHGEIAMHLKVNDDVLRVSRLNYRFDE